MKRFNLVVSVLSIVGCVASVAHADETVPAKRDKSVVTLSTTTVYGHPQRPTAAVEVSRARMTLRTLTPTLDRLTKIQDSSKKDPF